MTLGAWIQTVRNETHLTKKDLAAALDTSEEFIEQLSSDQLRPWTIRPVLMASILCLFRLHFDGLTTLALNSSMRVAGSKDSPELLAWLTEVSSELTKRGCADLLIS